jgi:ABC-type antimicrobial peptide transport system permease subunit
MKGELIIMNKPLSYRTFYKGNKKISMMYILTLVIAILILGITKIIISSTSNEMAVSIHQAEKLTMLQIVDPNVDDSLGLANQEVVNKIKELNSVDSVLPTQKITLPFRYFIGDGDNNNYFLKKGDVIKLLNCFGVSNSIKDLPNEGDKKALVSERVLKNSKLKLGGKIDENIDITIAKTFLSDFTFSVIPTEMPEYSHQFLIIPKSGKLAEMNSEIQNIINSNFELIDYTNVKNGIAMMQESAKATFFIVMIIITFACSITTGITTYIHYYNRRKEIGIMKAIGYSDKKIVLRITKEVCISTLIALTISLLLIVTSIWVLNVFIAETNGFVPFIFDYSLFSSIITIPIFMGIFSLVPTWIMLRTMDKITLIQRGY